MLKALSHLRYRLLTNSEIGNGLRKALWPRAGAADGVEELHVAARDCFGHFTTTQLSDPAAAAHFDAENTRWRVQSDRVIRVTGEITIEPRFGVPYLPGRKVVAEVLGVHPEVTPSLVRHWRDNRSPEQTVRLREAVYFDGFLSENIWHFWDDAINPSLLMDSLGLITERVPVIITRRVWERPWVRYVVSQEPFSRWNWYVQGAETVRLDRLYAAQASHAWYPELYRRLNDIRRPRGNRRIFLNRRARYGRNVRNAAAVIDLVRAYGFDVVYAEDLSFADQVMLFSEVEFFIGIHGAGLANLMFSDVQRLRCLEIHTSSYPVPCYYWLLQNLGAQYYDCMFAGELDRGNEFDVDTAVLKGKIERLTGSLV